MRHKNWRTISLPTQLLGEVEEILPKTNYATKSEFIRAAIRDKLREVYLTIAAKEASHFEGEVIEE